MISALRTGYARIDRIIAQAEHYGLAVELEDELIGDSHLVSVTIRIPVDSRDDGNMLGAINRATSMHLVWAWTHGNGRTPALRAATRYGWSDQSDLRKGRAYTEIDAQLYVMGQSAKRYIESEA